MPSARMWKKNEILGGNFLGKMQKFHHLTKLILKPFQYTEQQRNKSSSKIHLLNLGTFIKTNLLDIMPTNFSHNMLDVFLEFVGWHFFI